MRRGWRVVQRDNDGQEDHEQKERVERAQEEATWVPDTYVIIFLVVVLAAIATYFIPLGQFETEEITFTGEDGEEETRTAIDPDSFSLS